MSEVAAHTDAVDGCRERREPGAQKHGVSRVSRRRECVAEARGAGGARKSGRGAEHAADDTLLARHRLGGAVSAARASPVRRLKCPVGPFDLGTLRPMEGGGFGGFPFGGDPEDLMRGLREFAEQQAETVQEAQREQFATLTLNTAVELTAAALGQLQPTGGPDEQAIALRDAMRVLFPEAVALVSAARQGFMREG